MAHVGYTKRDMEVFNLLDHPVWVFDIENKRMWWANESALKKVWYADSLDTLLARDYTDMSVTTERRLNDYLMRYKKGERVSETWTLYPDGKTITIYNSTSGIRIREDVEGGAPHTRLLMLNEAELKDMTEALDGSALRGMELLRNLPVPVGQFDGDGQIMEQDQQSVHVFGGAKNGPIKSDDSGHSQAVQSSDPGNSFFARFVDPEEAARAWDQVYVKGEEYVKEVQQRTQTGEARWFAVQLRRCMDPVTGHRIVVYTACDIHARVQAKDMAAALLEANKTAETANRAKSEFVAVMAHEMRTPLHQVLGFLELLSETGGFSEAQVDYLTQVETAASALMAVVNDILDYTKLEAGRMTMEEIPFDPVEISEKSVQLLRSEALKKGLKMNVWIHPSLTEIRTNMVVVGDPSRLRQILLNLLGNAVKFTSQGGVTLRIEPVSLSGEDTEKADASKVWLRFTVEDTGIGIEPKKRKHVFDKYQQATSSITRTYGGTGLGLAICKKIVEILGGEIGVRSELGRGSEFWFQIPYGRVSIARSCEVTNASATSAGEESKPLHVLVAEDNKINQKLVKSILKRLGHECTVVENGRLAVEAVQSFRYDAVLMDVQMPEMDGIEATKVIRKCGWTKCTLPILGLTAGFNKRNHGEFLEIGMNDCLGKPCRMSDLKSILYQLKVVRMNAVGNLVST